MQDKYIISFAEKDDFKEIVTKLDSYFEKEKGYFNSLVPVLYGKGKNTYKNHIIVKDKNKIIGIIAVKKNVINIDDKQYSFLLLGSLAVDFEYRNQGIMGMLFDFILNKYSSEVDFFGLSGKFDRYKRFGFFPSEKMYKYDYSKKEIKYSFISVNVDNVFFCKRLHDVEKIRVNRSNMLDSLYMWEYKPFIIKDGENEIGYLIYNHKFNIVEEIVLLDNNLINEVMHSFAGFINLDTSLKLSMINLYLKDFIASNILYEEYFERTLYKIINPELKSIYIPRSDLI